MTSEQAARETIDKLLRAAGWAVEDVSRADTHAARGVAIRELPLPGYGFADYLLYIDGAAAGVIEAKTEGTTLSGVEIQSAKYTDGLPAGLPRWRNPLPFAYQSTGVETRFTNGLDPEPRARPDLRLPQSRDPGGMARPTLWERRPRRDSAAPAHRPRDRTRLQRRGSHLPLAPAPHAALIEEGLWPAQVRPSTTSNSP